MVTTYSYDRAQRLTNLTNVISGTKPGRGLCLEPHDCVASKLAAGRAKDYEFAAALVKAGLIKLDLLAKRTVQLDIDRATRAEIVAWIEGQRKLREAR